MNFVHYTIDKAIGIASNILLKFFTYYLLFKTELLSLVNTYA